MISVVIALKCQKREKAWLKRAIQLSINASFRNS